MKVARRKLIPFATSVDDTVYERRSTDGLVIDIRKCPQQIQAHGHWRRNIYALGVTNGVCLHTLDTEADIALEHIEDEQAERIDAMGGAW